MSHVQALVRGLARLWRESKPNSNLFSVILIFLFTYSLLAFSTPHVTNRTEWKGNFSLTQSISIHGSNYPASRGPSIFLVPTYLGRSKGLCSQGRIERDRTHKKISDNRTRSKVHLRSSLASCVGDSVRFPNSIEHSSPH